jgi:hypothetical protein
MKCPARACLSLVLLFGLVLLTPPGSGRSAPANPPPLVYLPLVKTALLSGPSIAGCPIFPDNNVWNAPVDHLPVDPNSDAYIQSSGRDTHFHADFGSGLWDGGPIGIPYAVVPAGQSLVPVSFDYAGESDPGGYPIPANPPVEGGPNATGDRHILLVQQGTCKLYELFAAYPGSGGGWTAGSGAIYDLRSNLLRPDTWTSADAAGLVILPGLARYDEFASGQIRHALRFTAQNTRNRHIWPARHDASSKTSLSLPPMGQRFRLKSFFDISAYSPQQQVFLKALKTYGMILADNGSNWYVSGAPDERWDNDFLHGLFDHLYGRDFEAVDESGLMLSPDSGQAR